MHHIDGPTWSVISILQCTSYPLNENGPDCIHAKRIEYGRRFSELGNQPDETVRVLK